MKKPKSKFPETDARSINIIGEGTGDNILPPLAEDELLDEDGMPEPALDPAFTSCFNPPRV